MDSSQEQTIASVKILPPKSEASKSSPLLKDKERLIEVVKKQFDLSSPDSPYLRAMVKVQVDYIVVHLPYKDLSTFDSVLIDLNSKLEVTNVERDYYEPEDDYDSQYT